jgi:hypothetical protein
MKKFFTGGVLVFFLSAPLYACSCVAPGSPKEELKRSAAVFSGKVKRIRKEGYSNVVQFEVLKSWKGVRARRMIVYTLSESSLCGYDFKTGHSYLVYSSSGKEAVLYTDICTRTSELETAAEDLKELGQ